MTMLILFLLPLVALGAGFGVVLWRLLHPAAVSGLDAAGRRLAARPAVDRYRPMGRLLAEDDFRFLASQSSGCPRLATRLRRQRIRVLRLYLRQMRAEFARVYGLARLLAPTSQDPAFAGRVLSLALTFSGLWVAMQVVCALGWLGPLRVHIAGLVTALDGLTEAVQASLPSPEPPLAFAARM